MHYPILTASDCEGAGEMFNVVTKPSNDVTTANNEVIASSASNSMGGFFGRPTYLSCSGQLHLEAACTAMGNVYNLSPIFRAEQGTSKEHLSEFRMLEVECAFYDSLDDLTQLMEENVRTCMQRVWERCADDISATHTSLPQEHRTAIENTLTQRYERVTYMDALTLLQQNASYLQWGVPTYGDDFNTEQENFVVKHFEGRPVFILDYPKQLKPFYMYENDDGRTVAAVDLIFPYCGELCGGSVREHRHDVLKKRMDQLKMNTSGDYDWYLDLRRYGTIPHAGYGMGYDRLVKFLLGINNIRDAVPFPRSPKSCLL